MADMVALGQRSIQIKRERAATKARVRAHATFAASAAQLAREIEGGVPSCMVNMALEDVLGWVRSIQPARKRKLAAMIGASERRRFGDLTERQLHVLGKSLAGDGRVRTRLAKRDREAYPVSRLRDAFLASGMSAHDVASRMEWLDHRGKVDSYRVKRALGMVPYKPRKGYPPRYKERCGYVMAERLAVAIGAELEDLEL